MCDPPGEAGHPLGLGSLSGCNGLCTSHGYGHSANEGIEVLGISQLFAEFALFIRWHLTVSRNYGLLSLNRLVVRQLKIWAECLD